MQLAELGENSELALVLSHFLRGLCYLRLLCQIDIRSEEKLILHIVWLQTYYGVVLW